MQRPQPVSQVAYALLIVLSLLGMRSNETWWPEVQAQGETGPQGEAPTGALGEPEIDRTDVWAIKYSRYLYHLAHEIKWAPSEAPFEIGIVGWKALGEQLEERYVGRSIAGRPISVVQLEPGELAEPKGDFQILFLSGDGDDRRVCRTAALNWHATGKSAGAPRNGLVVSDAWTDAPEVIDFRRHRKSADQAPGLCLEVDRTALDAIGLALPPIFESRTCPEVTE